MNETLSGLVISFLLGAAISSGGFMAHPFQVARSDNITRVGIVAKGPDDCAGESVGGGTIDLALNDGSAAVALARTAFEAAHQRDAAGKSGQLTGS